MNAPRRVTNLLTVDVEDYFHVACFADVVARDSWNRMEPRVEATVGRTLDMLDASEARGTFFFLGWVAERHPRLAKDVAARGHEIASHGYEHRMVSDMSADEFREDLRTSKRILEDLTGYRVRGYRAPTFSLKAADLWAWEILAEEGFEYDSSCYPIHHDRYGDPKGERFPHFIRTHGAGSPLLEFPLTTLRVFGVNLPAAGGGYLRLFPQSLIRAAIRQTNRHGFPAVIYFHPWELDPQQPRIRASWFSRFRHYVNLEKMEFKLRSLLSWTDFGPVGEYVDERKKSHPELQAKLGVEQEARAATYALPATVGNRVGGHRRG